MFVKMCKQLRIDCICDIGSRDGKQSILFRRVLPNADVIAFEACPQNYAKMQNNAVFKKERIHLEPFAVSNQKGSTKFHISLRDNTVINGTDKGGLSSLLVHKGNLQVQDIIEVETVRIDEYIHRHYPDCQSVALWIDVEGAEHMVLEGMSGIADKVKLIHVETAVNPIREGQRPLTEIQKLMKENSFSIRGSNIGKHDWGDVVFIRNDIIRLRRAQVAYVMAAALISRIICLDETANYLKSKYPKLYRSLWDAYTKYGV
jgi:FkbM family methyltransferase